jgi:hypothetical protein
MAHHIYMLHRYLLIHGAPRKGCATDEWAPPSTRAWGVRPPYPWRMIWGVPCIGRITVAHHIYIRQGYKWAHPLEKVADISVAHASLMHHCYIYLWSTILRCATDMSYLPP